jgi:hypothetical protein
VLYGPAAGTTPGLPGPAVSLGVTLAMGLAAFAAGLAATRGGRVD